VSVKKCRDMSHGSAGRMPNRTLMKSEVKMNECQIADIPSTCLLALASSVSPSPRTLISNLPFGGSPCLTSDCQPLSLEFHHQFSSLVLILASVGTSGSAELSLAAVSGSALHLAGLAELLL
jgi:hypothetical protein